jgi:hypothetical protein
VMPCSTPMPHSTWHKARNQAVVQPKDISVMGHCGKHMLSIKEVMVDLKCSPHSNGLDMSAHLQAHLEWIQHCLKTNHSFGWYLPPQLLQDNFQAHLGEPQLACQWNVIYRLWNLSGRTLQRLRICPQYQPFPMTNRMQIMRVTISRTWAKPKPKYQSAWSKRNSAWSNLPQGWGSQPLVPSTSGRKNGGLGFSSRSIGPSSRDRTIWDCREMDPCSGRRWLQIFWRLSSSGCLWKQLIMPNRFGDNGLSSFWRNVPARLGRRGRRQGNASSDRRRMWECVQAKIRVVTSESYQIQPSWLRSVECRMAPITRHPAIQLQVSSIDVRHWEKLIDFIEKSVTQKNHTVWLWYTNATWHRENWSKSIWDYMLWGKRWMTLYMVRFHTTVRFLNPASWNWNTMSN